MSVLTSSLVSVLTAASISVFVSVSVSSSVSVSAEGITRTGMSFVISSIVSESEFMEVRTAVRSDGVSEVLPTADDVVSVFCQAEETSVDVV